MSESAPEQHSMREPLGYIINGASIAYHGIMARLDEARADRAASRATDYGDHIAFLESLGRVARGVVDEKLPHGLGHNRGHVVLENMPQAAPTKNPLAAQAKSHEEMHSLLTTGDKPSREEDRKLDLSDLTSSLEAPQSRAERRVQRSVINNIRKIRNDRKTQSVDRKMYGATGMVSGWRTALAGEGTGKLGRFIARRREGAAYKSGDINYIELQNRKNSSQQTAEMRHPYQMRKRNLRIGRTERGVLRKTYGRADRYNNRRRRAENRYARSDRRASMHRQSQANLR